MSKHILRKSRHRTCRTRLGHMKSKVGVQKHKFHQLSLATICLVITCSFICTTSESSQSPLSSSSSAWVTETISSHVDNIISEDRSGTVFVLFEDYIVKFNSSNLSMLLSTRTNYTNVSNKILFTFRRGNLDLLSSCWATNVGLSCLLCKLDDLKLAALQMRNEQNQTFTTHASDIVRVLLDPHDSNNLLLITSRPPDTGQYNNRSESATDYAILPAISRFRMNRYEKTFALEQKSVLPYKAIQGNYDLYYDFIHEFNFGEHTHFVLNDIRKPKDNSSSDSIWQSVRLARICNNDTELTSYTEISISCNNLNNLYAKVAYFVPSNEDSQLYIVFETKQVANFNSKKTTAKSYICSYSMKLIEDIYRKAISDCNHGHPASFLLDKLHSSRLTCSKNPSSDWCRSKVNPYIDGYTLQYNVFEDFSMELTGMSAINFLQVTNQGSESREVFFIGTDPGLLTKLGRDEELLYTINFNQHKMKYYPIEGEKFSNLPVDEVNGKARYVMNSRRIVATMSNQAKLHSIDIDSCQHYNSCHTCITVRDPLDCVWCESSCSKKTECPVSKQSSLACPPIIEDYSPKLGPTTGSTKLFIKGENFGSPKGSLIVKLGDEECLIDKISSTSESIYCYTGSRALPSNATLNVVVNDETGYRFSKGSINASEQFQYVDVKLFGIDLDLKPINGTIIVFGDNLNAGANRSILIGNSRCNIILYNQFNMSCQFEKPSNQSEFSKSLPLKLIIDGHEQKIVVDSSKRFSPRFEYREEMFDQDDPIYNPVSEQLQEGNLFGFVFLLIVVFASLFLVALYIVKFDKFPRFKIPQLNKKSGATNELDGIKVSFRNPQSNKFNKGNSSPMASSEPLNGIVKFDSINRSGDYFGKPDYNLDQNKPLINTLIDEQTLSFLASERILIDRNRLTLGHVLGSGQFGRVYKGFLHVGETGENIEVAVKTLHSRCAWDDTLDGKAFLDEGLMMRDFEHENVLALIGVTFDSSGAPMVITPFMLYGDLRSYISDEASSPTVKELIEYGIQIAKGMAYLSNMKFVHRDLAARNCMLDENLTVKVADFGLSRDIYERDYYSSDNKKAKLPVKWMAIESLEKSIYSTKTDVWSYGVVLWELMTRGVVPYPDVDNFDLFSYLKEGRRMLRPRYCPILLYNIMLSCWHENPQVRPNFDELVVSVSSVINQLQATKNDDGQQKVSRDETYCDVFR